MKKSFGKSLVALFALILAISAVAVMSATAAAYPPDFKAAELPNLAKDGVAFADEWNDGMRPEYVNDDKTETSWQAKTVSDKGADEEGYVDYVHWIGIAWETTQTFDTIVIRWKDEPVTLNGVQFATEGGAADGKESGNPNWVSVEKGKYTSTPYNGDGDNVHSVFVITLDEAVEAKLVKIAISGRNGDSCDGYRAGEVSELEIYCVGEVEVSAPQENLALHGVIDVSSESKNDPDHGKDKANDGDVDSYWESETTDDPRQWISVSWDKAHTIDSLVTIWNGSKPSGDEAGYVSVEYLDEDGEYQRLDTFISRASIADGLHFDTIKWNEGEITTTSVKITFGAYVNENTTKYQCYELEVFGQPCDCEPEDSEEPESPTNVALASNGGTAFASRPTLTSNNVSFPVSNINDGNPDNRWTVRAADVSEDAPVYVGVTWETSYDISKVVINWSAEPVSYVIEYGTDGLANPDGTAGLANPTVIENGVDTVELSTPVTANGIQIKITEAVAGTNPSIFELEVYGVPTPENGNVITETLRYESATGDGVKDVFIATVFTYDEETMKKQVIEATYTVTRDGEEKSETVTINTAYQEITLGEESLSREGQYVTGILFKNVREGDTVEVDEFKFVPAKG